LVDIVALDRIDRTGIRAHSFIPRRLWHADHDLCADGELLMFAAIC
jgi:hypothetical protein